MVAPLKKKKKKRAGENFVRVSFILFYQHSVLMGDSRQLGWRNIMKWDVRVDGRCSFSLSVSCECVMQGCSFFELHSCQWLLRHSVPSLVSAHVRIETLVVLCFCNDLKEHRDPCGFDLMENGTASDICCCFLTVTCPWVGSDRTIIYDKPTMTSSAVHIIHCAIAER